MEEKVYAVCGFVGKRKVTVLSPVRVNEGDIVVFRTDAGKEPVFCVADKVLSVIEGSETHEWIRAASGADSRVFVDLYRKAQD